MQHGRTGVGRKYRPVHELALCGAIADIATRRAGEREVAAIHVRVGQLRQVVPDTLIFCWSLVTDDTPLAGSVLELERVAALLECAACRDRHAMGDSFSLACPVCGALDVAVLAGDEFVVTALDLAAA
jgi:hydrogenase nickel incorporation protein HypA/HybF